MDADENGEEADGGSVVTLSAPCTPRSPPETIVIEDSEEEEEVDVAHRFAPFNDAAIRSR